MLRSRGRRPTRKPRCPTISRSTIWRSTISPTSPSVSCRSTRRRRPRSTWRRCASCRAELAQLRADLDSLSGQLAALPTATMPVTVAAQLDRVLAGERATVLPFRRSAPLKAPASASYVKQTGVVRIMLAAAVAAAVVGFGGYVVSASAGLNEPSALSPTQVHRGGPGRPGPGPGPEPEPRSAPVLGRLALRP